MNFSIRKANRGEAKPLLGLYGESGTGKTYSSLLLARGFSSKGRIVMIETEAGRGEAYCDMIENGYEVVSLRNDFSSKNFGAALSIIEEAKADVLIVDSASAEWSGAGGVLSMASDNQEKGIKGVLVWQQPKMQHQRHFMLRLLQTPIPLVILCLRAKYPMIEKKWPDGKREWVRSETLEPDQAADILFELFVHGWLDQQHRLHITKYTRPDLAQVIRDNEPITIDTGRRLAAWASGVEAPQTGKVAAPKAAPASKQSPVVEAGAALSVIDMGREAAKRGKETFDVFYKRQTKDGKAALREIKPELTKLMAEHEKELEDFA